jgi:hypothetical protein
MEISRTKAIIVSVISAATLFELLWGVSYLSSTSLPLKKSQAEEGAALSLNPAQKALEVGEEFEVRLDLNTNGIKTSGVDAIINYDPSLVEILDADGNAQNGVQIRPGLLFPQYPVNEVDEAAGRIGFSAAALPPNSFAGQGTLAYIKLRALRPGTAALQIEFKKGGTADSNVVEAGSRGDDVLDKVINALYSIK